MNANASYCYDTATGRLRHSLAQSLDGLLFALLSALLTLAAATSFVEDPSLSAARPAPLPRSPRRRCWRHISPKPRSTRSKVARGARPDRRPVTTGG